MGGWIVGARPVSVFAQGVAHNPDIKGELTVMLVFYYIWCNNAMLCGSHEQKDIIIIIMILSKESLTIKCRWLFY